jgi:Phage integrase, N-terminal SAM-like domain
VPHGIFIVHEICAREGAMAPPDYHLPAILKPGTLATVADSHLVPAVIADAGEPAAWRYIEFFTANIRNPNTRRAYARACSQFFAWCEDRGLTLTTIRPFDVATYIETLQQTHAPPGVKQQLAAVRMLFDWLITGQVVPINPAAAVRGPKHVVKTGKTPVLDAADWRKLLDGIPCVICATERCSPPSPFGRKARVGGCGCTRKAASIIPCRAIMRSPRRCTLTSRRPALPRIAQELAVPHQPRTRRHRVIRTAHESIRRLAHDPPARGCRRHSRADRQSHVPRDRHHRLPCQWRRA